MGEKNTKSFLVYTIGIIISLACVFLFPRVHQIWPALLHDLRLLIARIHCFLEMKNLQHVFFRDSGEEHPTMSWLMLVNWQCEFDPIDWWVWWTWLWTLHWSGREPQEVPLSGVNQKDECLLENEELLTERRGIMINRHFTGFSDNKGTWRSRGACIILNIFHSLGEGCRIFDGTDEREMSID